MANFEIKNGVAVIPEGTTTIGDYAFSGCSSLQSITIPEGVTEIGNGAFYGCSSLQSITIPDGVTEIGLFAFFGCSSLQSITIPESVTEIGEDAFRGCSGLTSITIPASVKLIRQEAFKGCSALNEIIVDKGNTVYDSREGCNAIIGPNDVLLYGCNTTVIPASVKEIAEEAFFSCSTLKSITIPIGIIGMKSRAKNSQPCG